LEGSVALRLKRRAFRAAVLVIADQACFAGSPESMQRERRLWVRLRPVGSELRSQTARSEEGVACQLISRQMVVFLIVCVFQYRHLMYNN
jgi:hypothetical protein